MQVIIHEIANQILTLIWIWRVILISRFGSVQCYAIYMNNHIFFLNSTDIALHSREWNIMFLSAVWWLTVFSELAGSVNRLSWPSCPLMHGTSQTWVTHWDPRSTGLANELIDHWQVHKKLPPHLAYILWNCSGMDVNNLEAILVMTWHRQGAFQIQYGIF